MKKIIAVALAALLVFAMAGCLAEETIKIGFIGPLTGAEAVYGNSCYQGAQIAVDEINALGGMQIELNPQDDEHDAEKSVNAHNTLWDWGAQMIVGCVTTSPCKAVASVAYEDRMFMLTPSASSVDVTAGKDNVFQVCFNDPAQGKASALYISENGLPTKVAVIYNNADAYSTGIYQTFTAEAAQVGLEIVSVTTFTDDTTDFSVQLTDAKDKGAELVFLPIYYNPASMILKQAKAMEYAPVFFGVDGMDGILTMEGFDTSLAEGVMLLTPFAADAQDERTQKFVSEYEKKYNDTPTQFSADGYDAVYTLYEACQKAGVTSETSAEDACEMLVAVMPTLNVSGLTGDMVWNAEGQVDKEPKAVTIVNGAYVGNVSEAEE
ncbi:MAG: ABC transporter substrate-binding protein [Clostridia bacterium]|nr:ABC transporter substrate-binding protein [Clostridia bacterium]